MVVLCKPGWPKKRVNVTFYEFFDVRFYQIFREIIDKDT